MSTPAIVSLLWQNNLGVVEAFVRRNPGTVVLAPGNSLAGDAAVRIEAAGGRVELLDTLIETPRRVALEAQIAARRDLLSAVLKDPQWRRHWADIPIAPQVLADCLYGEAQAQLPQLMMLVAALVEAARRYTIRLLVMNEDLRALPRLAVHWARGAGIPSLHVSHSVLLGEPYTVHGRIYADVVAVFGERGQQGYLDIGLDPARLRVTGNPCWDGYAEGRGRRTEIRAATLSRNGLKADMPVVVFGTTWAANLSALGDEGLYGSSLRNFLVACRSLRERGIPVQAVIKDRPQNQDFGPARLRDLLAEVSLPPGSVLFTAEPASDWVLAADVLVSVDSNLSIEAMLAGVPAVNLTSELGIFLGPPFDADSGVAEAESAAGLADSLQSLLNDADYRQRQLAAMQRAAPFHNSGVDGQATGRVVALMEQLALPAKAGRYLWETLLEVQSADATQYHNWAQTHLFELFDHAPRRVLDIGCGAGGTGGALKAAYPQAEVWGIEVNRAAAEVAATRIDHALAGKFEEIDLDAVGITPGSLDTVIVADVLEHMYDPWRVMVRLKPYLSPDAQVIASIPNIRNLIVMAELAKGNWHYDEFGLLDITHIRFFTLREVKRFFHETGYRVTQLRYNIDGRLAEFFNRHRNENDFTVEFDRLTLKNVSAEEFGEMCSLQFHVRAQPGSMDEEAFIREAGEIRPDYSTWCAAHLLTHDEARLWDAHIATWETRPGFHLIVYATARSVSKLSETVASVGAQLYEHVRLTVVAAAPAPAQWADNDRLAWCDGSTGLLETANRVLAESGSDWVCAIDAGDCLPPHALLFLAEAAGRNPAWQVMYSDEDSLTAKGERQRPHFKSDFNGELLRSYPYVGGVMFLRRELFTCLGGFNPDFEGIEDYDLVLRAWEKCGDGSIGHIADVLFNRREGGGHAEAALPELSRRGQRALLEHLQRTGIDADVLPGFLPLSQRVVYRHGHSPRVSVIIVARDDLDSLRRTVEALIGKTAWPDYELLIVDAGSCKNEIREFLTSLESLGDSRIRTYCVDPTAQLAALHNLLAEDASGEFLLFLHFDAVVLSEDWLGVLMNHGRVEGIGIVGPRLLNSSGQVRRTGLVLGVGGGTESAFSGIKYDETGYFGRALLEQRVSAVGGGAFLTPKRLFNELGGFDPTLGVDAAEVDYCLRAAEIGQKTVWTPHASLCCDGLASTLMWSGSAAVVLSEALQPRWLQRLAHDPYYNRNLRKTQGGAFLLEHRPLLAWDPLPWKPLPRVLAHPADLAGCGRYRILSPLNTLTANRRIQGWADMNLFDPVQLASLELDSIIFQRQITDPQIEMLERHRRYSSTFKVFELDDFLIRLPQRSAHRGAMPEDIAERIKRATGLCDRFIVSTEPLADAYRGLNQDIRVVQNYLERNRWSGFSTTRNDLKRPRVGWVGGAGHSGDLEMIAEVVQELANEVDWVFMGMCPESFRPFVREFHEGVPFERYPDKMAALKLDLAIAPLEINPFNEAKSHLRILEYGILGYPVVCSDIFPYQGAFPVTRVKNRNRDWVDAIRAMVSDLDAAYRSGQELKAVIERDWMLEDHLDDWLSAWLP